jgi:hypothetical protein
MIGRRCDATWNFALPAFLPNVSIQRKLINTLLEAVSNFRTIQPSTIETCPSLGQMELFDILDHVSYTSLALTALWLSSSELVG